MKYRTKELLFEESLYPDLPGIYSIHKQELISKMAARNLIGTDFTGG